MSQSETVNKKTIATAIASFVGVMAAIPLAIAVYGPLPAGAADTAVSTAQVASPDDFAKFAYAYSQGFKTASATSSVGDVGACAEVVTGDAGSMEAASAAAMPVGHVKAGQGGSKAWSMDNLPAVMSAYYSYVYNSSSSTVSNSNNSIGSNNTTSNHVDVSDAKGVMVAITNDQDATNETYTDSYNSDSYNDTATTTTTTNNTAETKVIDSYNTKHETNTSDSNNTTTNESVIKDSYNTEKEFELELELGHVAPFPYSV